MATFACRRSTNTEKSRKTERIKGEKRQVAARQRLRLWFVLMAIFAADSLTAVAATITVTNKSDSGADTLRQAIITANNSAGADTIVFDFVGPGPHTIALLSVLPDLASDIAIINDRPGDERLTIQRSAGLGFRIFKVTPDNVVVLAGLTITKGALGGTERGAGIWNNHGTLTLRNCTIAENDSNDYAGGIYNDGIGGSAKLNLVNCLVRKNTSRWGGGVYNIGNGTLSVVNCTFHENYGQLGGSGIYNDGAGGTGNASVFNSTFAENNTFGSGGTGGGGIRNYYATLEIGNNIFKVTNGGSVTDSNGIVTSRGHNLTNDAAGGDVGTGPGGLFNGTGDKRNTDPKLTALAAHGGLTQTLSLLAGSPAIDGGDDAVLNAPLQLTTDQRGEPRKIGAAVDIGAVERGFTQNGPTFTVTDAGDNNDPDCTTDDCTLIEALAAANANPDANVIDFVPGLVGAATSVAFPTGLPINAPVTINGPGAKFFTVTGGSVARAFLIGAGAGDVSISGLQIGGTIAADGGAILNNARLTLTECFVYGGFAVGYSGGGVYSGMGTTLTLNRCTFASNFADQYGGGVFNDGILTATNCTFDTNRALRGGGLISRFAGGASRMTLRNCTITNNTATDGVNTPGFGGGGVYAEGNNQQYFAANNIIAGNISTNDPDVRGNFTSQGHNLIGVVDDSVGWGASGDLLGADPQLMSREDYGGPVPTAALSANSPARDKGDDALAPPTDQRGFPRVGVSDIGSFEFGSSLPTATTLANISTRLRVETGDDVLIGGFIVTGTQAKKVILRAIGPSLNLPGQLDNPTLELHSGSTLIAMNDDWKTQPDADRQAVIDSTIPPANDLESALVRILPANGAGYTAIVRGANNGTGIGIVEAYDLDRTVDSKLANISTRGFVQTGDNVLIAGTIVFGSAAQKVIVRALGPSLAVAGKMENPTLELRDQNGGLIEANDNWIDSPNKQAIIDSTIPPANDLESAIVQTLAGNGASYTAIVRGANNTTGVAVVEVYALQ